MKKIICTVFVFNFLLISCSKEDANDGFYDATVLNQQVDCKDFVIQFRPNAMGLPVDSSENKFSALNLPETYRTEGMRVRVKVRKPNDDEFLACTTLGTRYPEIFITEIE